VDAEGVGGLELMVWLGLYDVSGDGWVDRVYGML
jgi:hypothetical protein